MNSAHINQRNNTLFFIGAVTLSVAMLTLSGLALKSVLSGDAGSVSAAAKACTDTMRTLGFSPMVKKDSSIQAALYSQKNIESLVYKSGVIMASCPSYTVYDYCAGAGCLKPGVTFTLKPKEL